jgi:Terminase large subunit, T4likevirus-type, N-terminal
MSPTATRRRVPRLDKDALFRQLRYVPHAGQREVHASRAPRRVLACGTRWGKSTCGAMEAVAALLEPRETRGWIVAPTQDLAGRIFREIEIALRQYLPHRIEEVERHRIAMRNLRGGLSEVVAKTADHPVSLLGEALHWLIVDEAARMKEEVWARYLSPRLVDHDGWALLLSTPNGCNWFRKQYRLGQKNRDPRYRSWNSPSSDNPHLDPAVIEEERRRLQPNDFREQYEAVFLGAELEPCDTCGCPSPTAKGILVLDEGEEPLTCPECNEPVEEDGTTLVELFPSGTRHLLRIILEDTYVPDERDDDLEPREMNGEPRTNGFHPPRV